MAGSVGRPEYVQLAHGKNRVKKGTSVWLGESRCVKFSTQAHMAHDSVGRGKLLRDFKLIYTPSQLTPIPAKCLKPLLASPKKQL